MPRAQVINYEPSLTLALNESCQLQCRLAVETRTNAYQVRTREFGDDQISVYFTVRQYWGTGPDQSFLDSLQRQREIGEEILQQSVIPRDRPSPGAGDRLAVIGYVARCAASEFAAGISRSTHAHPADMRNPSVKRIKLSA